MEVCYDRLSPEFFMWCHHFLHRFVGAISRSLPDLKNLQGALQWEKWMPFSGLLKNASFPGTLSTGTGMIVCCWKAHSR